MKKEIYLLTTAIAAFTSIFSSAIADTGLDSTTQTNEPATSVLIPISAPQFSVSASFGIHYNVSELNTYDIFLLTQENLKTYAAAPQPIVEINAKYNFYNTNDMKLSAAAGLMMPLNDAKVINDELMKTQDPISFTANPMITTFLTLEKKITEATSLHTGFGAMLTKAEVKNADYMQGVTISNTGDYLSTPYLEFGLASTLSSRTKLVMKMYYAHDFSNARIFDNAKIFFGTTGATDKSTLKYLVAGTLFSVEKSF